MRRETNRRWSERETKKSRKRARKRESTCSGQKGKKYQKYSFGHNHLSLQRHFITHSSGDVKVNQCEWFYSISNRMLFNGINKNKIFIRKTNILAFSLFYWSNLAYSHIDNSVLHQKWPEILRIIEMCCVFLIRKHMCAYRICSYWCRKVCMSRWVESLNWIRALVAWNNITWSGWHCNVKKFNSNMWGNIR